MFSYKTRENIKKIFILIRSYWLQPQFKDCGKSSRFESIGRIVGAKAIKIGNRVHFSEGFYLTVWLNISKNAQLLIGDDCHFGAYNHITCTNKIIIGDNLLTGKWVTITDNSHGETDIDTLAIPPSKRDVVSKGPIIIGDNVWIGDKATILPGVTIGKGAVIAANSVVTKDVDPYSVVGGIPSKSLNFNRLYKINGGGYLATGQFGMYSAVA